RDELPLGAGLGDTNGKHLLRRCDVVPWPVVKQRRLVDRELGEQAIQGACAELIAAAHGCYRSRINGGPLLLKEPHEIEHYFAALKMTCPKLSDGDLQLLREKLKEVRPKLD